MPSTGRPSSACPRAGAPALQTAVDMPDDLDLNICIAWESAMEAFIIRKNLELLERRLAEAKTDAERETIGKLLVEERAKAIAASISRRKIDDA